MLHSAAVQPTGAAGRGHFVLLAPLLARRVWCVWIAVAALVHLGLANANGPGFGCTIRTLTGHACPGCGLTKATLALVHGRWLEALEMHPLVLLFAVVMLVVIAAAALPDRARELLARGITRTERKVPFAALGCLALFGYWCLRLF